MPNPMNAMPNLKNQLPSDSSHQLLTSPITLYINVCCGNTKQVTCNVYMYLYTNCHILKGVSYQHSSFCILRLKFVSIVCSLIISIFFYYFL